MYNDVNSTIGLLLVNSEGKIVDYNRSAQTILQCELLNKDINSILDLSELNFSVEKIELEANNQATENIKYIYFLKNSLDYDKHFYKKILDHSHDEIFVTDGKGISIYCNKAFEKHYGMERSQIIGKKSWYISDIGLCGESPIPLVIKHKKQITIEQETKIGKKLTITATPVFDNEGNIEIIVENSRDITELENIRKNLDETKKLVKKYKKEITLLREKELGTSNDIIYNSDKLKELMKFIERIANVDSTVLILGESGTGKSHIAKHIHQMSKRRDKPFITINCATIPEHLLESELFGYSPGAFTGAKKSGKTGLVELADGGTLFLDEIGELHSNLQAKFLELIQERHFTPIGEVKPQKIDVRIISATNRDLKKLVKEKKFREDLYYRLKVVEIEVPSLRERPEDIRALIYFFLNKFDKQYNFCHTISEECIKLLENYTWKGNIRELQHIIEQLVVTVSDTLIEPSHLPRYFHENGDSQFNIGFDKLIPLDLAIETLEKELILKAYKELGSSYKVASALGISQSKASRKIRRYLNEQLG
ncbi:sigma 54-interacting transcriptional regulator [Wukongibacter baidiensis]|uniref:sigma-54 interaction domain-containing protein n=1 Tax=Wukongibacter baidiensis TaxID=1723361 RepID=UPI003D7F8FEC